MTAGYFEWFYFLNVVCIIYFARINFIHHLLFMSVSPREVLHRLGLQSSNCSFVPQIILVFVTYMMTKLNFLSFEWRPVNSPVHPYQQRRTLTQAHTHTHTLWSVLMRSSAGEGIAFSNTQASAHECRAFASVAALTGHTYVLIKLNQTLLLHQVCVSHPVRSAASLMSRDGYR